VDASSHVVLAVYHGTRPIEFEKGKAGIAVQGQAAGADRPANRSGAGRRAGRALVALAEARRGREGPARGVTDQARRYS
jgi:hypothetical protein